MTLEELSEFGQALYGPYWQSALARDLGVSDRTVRRWVSFESPVPTGLRDELEKLLVAQADRIGGFTPDLDRRRLFHMATHAVFQYDAEGQVVRVHAGDASASKLAVLQRLAVAVARHILKISERKAFRWRDQQGLAEASKPFEDHDPAERLRRIQEIMAAARGKATPGANAARSADFLYDEDGLPN